MSSLACSSNVFGVRGATVFTSAAPSTMSTLDSGFVSGSVTLACSTSTKSDFIHVCSFPLILSEAGRLILMFEELLQVTLSGLAGDEEAGKQIAVFLQ